MKGFISNMSKPWINIKVHIKNELVERIQCPSDTTAAVKASKRMHRSTQTSFSNRPTIDFSSSTMTITNHNPHHFSFFFCVCSFCSIYHSSPCARLALVWLNKKKIIKISCVSCIVLSRHYRESKVELLLL